MDRRALIGRDGCRWQIDVPRTRRERIRGLRGRPSLCSALLLERCRSIHTIGLRFPIAVAFLDRELTVLEVARVPPRRILRPRLRARHVLELPIGADVRVGDRLRWAGRRSRTTPDARRTDRPPRT